MILLHILVPEITDILAESYTHIRVYTDTAEDGDFTTLDGTAALVAGQVKYGYVDTDGTSSTWYKVAYYGTTPGESDKSDAMQGGVSDAYATPDEIKAELEITGTTYDARFLALAERATKFINTLCQRKDGFVADANASARTYDGSGLEYQWIDECISVSTVEVKDAETEADTAYDTWTADTDWRAAQGTPSRPDWNRTPYTFLIIDPNSGESYFTEGMRTVRVTARWGYAATVPDEIKQACIIQAGRWWKRGQSGYADTAGGPEWGELRFARKLDPDVEAILKDGGWCSLGWEP